MTSIALPRMNQLSVLNLSDNRLTSFSTSGVYDDITKIDLSSNRLETVTIPGGTETGGLFYTFTATNNRLTSVTIGHVPGLTELNLAFNKLTTITVPGIGKLEYLTLNNNTLTSATIGNSPALEYLNVSYNCLGSSPRDNMTIQGTNTPDTYITDNNSRDDRFANKRCRHLP